MDQMDKEKKEAVSIPMNEPVQELPEIEWKPIITQIRWLERRFGYKNLNIKRTLQTCYYDKDGKEIWEDVPLIIDQ